MSRLRATTLAVALVLSSTASASDQNGLFSIRGAGLLSCNTYVEEREKASDVYVMIGGWLDGYITAVNELSDSTFDVAPYATTELLTILIDRHCRNNPADILFSVTNSLLARLFDDRLRSSSAFVDVRVDLAQTRLYIDTILRIQRALVAKGLVEIEVTGQWDIATREGITSYQESVGLKGTGFPDQTTLWRLLRSE